MRHVAYCWGAALLATSFDIQIWAILVVQVVSKDMRNYCSRHESFNFSEISCSHFCTLIPTKI